jgi:hypothetical protein
MAAPTVIILGGNGQAAAYTVDNGARAVPIDGTLLTQISAGVFLPTTNHALGVRMTVALELDEDIGGVTPAAQTVDAHLGVRMAVALGLDRDLSEAPSLGVRMAATLTREIHISAAAVLGVRTAALMHNVSSGQPVVVVIT